MTASDSFDSLQYLAANPDLIAAFGTDVAAAAQHYSIFGQKEGRTTRFDALGYLAANRDLIAAFGGDVAAATRHYITNGRNEGRTISFDAAGYLAANGDLLAAFGSDTGAATQHYVAYGFREGRGSSFDALGYLASNRDLIAAFGSDTAAATRHYITKGYREGRNTSFDTTAYMAANAGLSNALGNNEDLIKRFYVSLGYLESGAVTFRDGALRVNLDLAGAGAADFLAAVDDYSRYRTQSSSLPFPIVISSSVPMFSLRAQRATPMLVGDTFRDRVLDGRLLRSTLEAGTTYTFILRTTESDPATLTLFDGNGGQQERTLQWIDEDSIALTYRPVHSGDYYLQVDASDYAGAVSLITGTVPTDDYISRSFAPGRIRVGGTVNGTIERPRDRDAFELGGLQDGFSYRIVVTSNLADGSAVNLSVSNPQGPVEITRTTPSQSNQSAYIFTPTMQGYTYTIAVDSATGTGSYSLTATREPRRRVPGDLTVGNPYNATIGHLETQYRTVWLDAGTTYTFLSQFERPSRNYLHLQDPDGQEVAADADLYNIDKTFVYTAATSGLHRISVSAIDEGAYTLSAVVGDAIPRDEYAADSSTTGRLTVGGSVSGGIQRRGDEDWLAIDLAADSTYRFTLITERWSNSDTVPTFYAKGADGELPVGYIPYPNGNRKEFVIKSETAGVYYVRVNGYAYQGGYTVSVATTDDYDDSRATKGRLSVGGSVTAHSDYGEDRDWFAITLDARSTYSFTASGPGANELYLFDANKTPLAVGNGRLNYTAFQSGTYFLQHQGVGWQRGSPGGDDYTVSATLLSTLPATGSPAAGMLAAF